jgi:hypothetical protein
LTGMDSDSALRALAAIAQGSVALAGLMLVATTFYLARSKGVNLVFIGRDQKGTAGEKAFVLFTWSFVIVVPVAFGLFNAYATLQLMLEVPSNVVLSAELAAKVESALQNFYYLIFYVVLDTIVFVLGLPLIEGLRSKRRKSKSSTSKKEGGTND